MDAAHGLHVMTSPEVVTQPMKIERRDVMNDANSERYGRHVEHPQLAMRIYCRASDRTSGTMPDYDYVVRMTD
jgi:hypothetical protein